MRKEDELTREHTCMQHAHPKEMVFVLLSRDAAAPVAIRAWVTERLRLKKNVETDPQIIEALECARVMEEEGRCWAQPGDAKRDRCGVCAEVTANQNHEPVGLGLPWEPTCDRCLAIAATAVPD